MPSPPVRASLRSAFATVVRVSLVAALLAWVPTVAVSTPVVACSCVGPMPLTEYAKGGSVILAGRVDGRDPRGVRVAVARWFAGPGAAPVAWIAGDFGNGASCGVGQEPPVGSEWLWVAYRGEDSDDLSISICAPTARLDQPEGRQLLAEAERSFGPGIVLPGTGASPPEEPSAGAPDLTGIAAALAVVSVAAIALAGGLGLAARRSGRRG